jgi:hypothetical protein
LRLPRGTVKLPSVTPENRVERKWGKKERKKRKKRKEKHTYTTAS